MQENFRAVGLSYKNTPLEIRESVTFDEEQTKKFLLQMRDILGVEEALILSTCNRTEIYYFASEDVTENLIKLIDVFHGLINNSAGSYFQRFGHFEAINQLFEVSMGLDSMVLGDIQISNQVKKAYQWTCDEHMAGPFLHRLLHTIFYTNKRVVQETPFKDGNASVASSSVGIAEKFIMNFTNPKILIVGLGEIGENVAENLKEVQAEVTLINRTESKAVEMAERFGFQSASMTQLADYVEHSQVVISAVRSESPIINMEMLGEKVQPKLFIDLSVPRSISEDVDRAPGILLYNVDQLQLKANEAIDRRKHSVQDVKKIIQESISEFSNWSQEMEISPTIKKLKLALDDIRKQELERYLGKIDEKHSKILDQATKNIIQKVIKLPVLQLKAACKRGEQETLVDVLNDLFNLETVEEEHKYSK